MLKQFRVWISITLFLLITFYFVDYRGVLSNKFHGLLHLQFIPAVISGMLGAVALLTILTLLFGRVYCSSLCPMGVCQDLVNRAAQMKGKIKRKFKFTRAQNKLRIPIAVVTALVLVIGFPFLIGIIDPYSAYGRIAVQLIKPVYITGNNLLARIFTSFGNYTFYKEDVFIAGMATFLIALFTLIVIGWMSWRHGRRYCNTICPVGTVLGFVAIKSRFRIRINDQLCNGCGRCETRCKAECIDSKNHFIDHTRCVACFNCLDSCNKSALSYTTFKKNEQKQQAIQSANINSRSENAANGEKGISDGTPRSLIESIISPNETTGPAAKPVAEPNGNQNLVPVGLSSPIDVERRKFIIGGITAAVAVPVLAATENVRSLNGLPPLTRQTPIAPPGAGSIESMQKRCTGCQLCMSKCPSKVIKPASLEYGLGGFMQPMMYFERGFCNYDCTVCSEVCPNGALEELSKEQKHLTQIGQVVFNRDLCIVITEGNNCGACSEHCPTQAVRMIPYGNGLTLPEIDPDICVGCGGCEFICPVRPYRAIYVEGNRVHKPAKPYEEEAQQEYLIDDFGF